MDGHGDEVEVRVEVPRGGFVKWRANGRVDFLSPIPCPFNYGSVPGTRAADGDPVDALVLGPTLARGRTARFPVWGEVPFVDAGVADPKLVCAPERPTGADWRRIRRFFAVYTWAKRVVNRLRGRRGWTGVRW